MHRSRRRTAAAALGALLVTVGAAGPAAAAITSSAITSPADPAFRTFNADLGADAGSNSLTVSGRVTSPTRASERVDIRCFWTDSSGRLRANPFALAVPIASDGSFSVARDPATLGDNPFGGPTVEDPSGTVDDASGVQTCRLRATTPVATIADLDTGSLPEFAGPRINVARFGSSSRPVRGGGNVTTDFSVGAGGLRGQVEWASAGGCGPFSFRPFVNPAGLTPALYPNWDCVAAILAPDANDTASQLRVDGRDAYTASSAPALDFDANGTVELPAGAGGLAVDYSRDAVTGAVVTTERSAVQRCDGAAFPPTALSCAGLSATGVDFERRTVLADDGLEVTVTDVLRSTDGATHAVDLALEQYVVFDNAPAFRFPGDSAFAPYGPGGQPELGERTPATVLTRDAISPDTPRQGTGAETWALPPDDVRFFATNFQYRERYLRTVPAGGVLTLTHVFRAAQSEAEATAGARSAEDRLGAPTVTLTAPADGSTVTTQLVAVSGTATDSVGVSALTVNGQPVAVGADGAFATAVTLPAGTTDVTAVARDGAQNTAQATITLTFAPPVVPRPTVTPARRCAVPRVRRGALYGTARSQIKRAGCLPGRRRTVRSATRRGRVVRISPAGGRHVALDTKVRIDVSGGRTKMPRRRSKPHPPTVREHGKAPRGARVQQVVAEPRPQGGPSAEARPWVHRAGTAPMR